MQYDNFWLYLAAVNELFRTHRRGDITSQEAREQLEQLIEANPEYGVFNSLLRLMSRIYWR